MKASSELRATDWILQRWAASVGDGLLDAPWEDVPISRVPVLNDHTAIVVDQMIMRSGEKTKHLIGYWYRTALPKSTIAQRIGVSRDGVYLRWNAALWYFRERFIHSPLSDLRLAATVDVSDEMTERRMALAKQSPLDYAQVSIVKVVAEANVGHRRSA
jgi:hypothetical protein